MDKDFQILKEQIQDFVNKYDLNGFNVEIFKLYKKKIIFLDIEGDNVENRYGLYGNDK